MRKVCRALAYHLSLLHMSFLALHSWFDDLVTMIRFYCLLARFRDTILFCTNKPSPIIQASMFLNVVVLPSLLALLLATRVPLPCIGHSNRPYIKFLGLSGQRGLLGRCSGTSLASSSSSSSASISTCFILIEK
jgi:hypothetical protein